MFYVYQDNELVRPVLTSNRGVINEKDVNIGDKLIEFNTNREIEVLDIESRTYKKLYGVKFTDGREEIFDQDELVYGIKYLFHPKDLMYRNIGWAYPLKRPVIYKQKVSSPKVHPYVAGALWAYGDFDYPYINLPLDRVDKNSSILNNMDCDIFATEGNRAYFKYRGDNPEEPLWWKDLFPYYSWYEDKIKDPCIPFEYAYGSCRDRLTFLRGIFDYGYNTDVTPDTVSINHWSNDRIHGVQWLLWSFGVLSRIDKEKVLTDVYPYRLEITGKDAATTSLFNDESFITQMLSEPNRVLHRTLPDELRIMTVYEIESADYRLVDTIPVFITANKHDVYYSGQFLPRVTK